MIKPS